GQVIPVAAELVVDTVEPVARLRCNELGMVEEGGDAGVRALPGRGVRRKHKITGVPEGEGPTRIDDRLRCRPAQRAVSVAACRRAGTASEEPQVPVEAFDDQGIGVLNSPADAVARLDRVALPGSKFLEAVRGGLPIPGEGLPE